MASLRDRLERDLERISPPDLTYDDLWRRRARVRRNQRLTAMGVALAAAAVSILLPLGILRDIGGDPVPPAAAITRSTIGDLEVAWSLRSDSGGFLSPPATVGDAVVAFERPGSLVALEATSGTRLWSASVDEPSTAGVAALGERVYVVSGSGQILGFDSRCRSDGGSCSPVWTAVIDDASITAITPTERLVLASSTRGVHALEVSCGTSPCRPVWTALLDGGVTGAPVVAGERSVVASADGSLYAFDLDCGADESACSPAWFAPPTSATAYVSAAAGDEFVYAGGTDGGLYGFPTACRTDGGTCPAARLGTTSDGGAVRGVAVTESQVLAAPSSGGMEGFSRSCALEPCEAMWRIETERPLTTGPRVWGGIVFGATVDGSLIAVDASCTRSCEPLWTMESGLDTSTIAVTSRAIVAGGGGMLLGFTASDSEERPPEA